MMIWKRFFGLLACEETTLVEQNIPFISLVNKLKAGARNAIDAASLISLF